MESTTTDRLKHVLESIQKDLNGILGFVIFTNDGFPIISTLPVNPRSHISEQELFSAIGAGLIALSERTLRQIKMSGLNKITIESSDGNVAVEKIDDETGIMAISTTDTPLGMLRLAVEKARKSAKEILS